MEEEKKHVKNVVAVLSVHMEDKNQHVKNVVVVLCVSTKE
jgi:hypothetical protein